MKVIFILSIMFWEYHGITAGNVQEKVPMMIDMPDGCFGVNCTASHADVKRDISNENQTKTKLSEQQPLISTSQSGKPKINVVNRRGHQKLERAEYFREEIVPIKKRQKRRVFVNRRKATKVRIVAIKATTMNIESTKLIKEILNGSVVHLNSLFGEACNRIKQESESILLKLTTFASQAKTIIKDKVREGKLWEAQALAAKNVDEASKLSFINSVEIPSIYFPSVKGIIDLIESNAIKTLKTSTSLDNKMVKLQTINERVRSFIDTQTHRVSSVARKCGVKFSEIGQLGIDKLKVYSYNTDRLFTELADTYGKLFSAVGEDNYDQENYSFDASNDLIHQIKHSNREKCDDVFASTSGPLDLLVNEVKDDIREIVKNKVQLHESV